MMGLPVGSDAVVECTWGADYVLCGIVYHEDFSSEEMKSNCLDAMGMSETPREEPLEFSFKFPDFAGVLDSVTLISTARRMEVVLINKVCD